ncbi:hypothetical protein NL676_031407 [Syzygium grande]|nr:hypothetical protein NL676_031407 [Syzygium grande]
MENNDRCHDRDCDDQPKGMHVNRQREVGVIPCTPSSSQELVAAAPSSEDEFPLEFPFGYIFAPTDQELILHYLKPKVMGDPIPLSDLFANVDLYKFDPRKLIGTYIYAANS